MTTTTNLNIGLIDTNQSQKEVTANEAIQALENAITETLDVECTDSTGGNIVADDDYRECICLRLIAGSPGPATTVEVELPAIKRAILVRNECGQDADIYCAGDLSTVTVANGATALLYNDGTTVRNVAGGSSSGATTFTGLTDAPASYTGHALKVPAVKADESGLEFISASNTITLNEQADDYTLTIDDRYALVALNKATDVTLTVPEYASVPFQPGTVVYVMQLGGGQVTVAEGATGVDLLTRSTYKTAEQYAVIRLINLDNDVWSLDGSLEGAATTDPYDVGLWIAGAPSSSEVVMRFVAVRDFQWAVDLAGSAGNAGVAATAQTDFDVQHNGVSVGTIRFAAAGTTATFIAAVGVLVEVGDAVSVLAPATPDATLADISITLKGTRA